MSDGKVYFKNKLAGEIVKNNDGSFEFYHTANAVPVSLTLSDIQKKYSSDELFPFFDGLIPEGWLLSVVEKNWKISKNDRWSLLMTTCQDCIGAAHVLESSNVALSISSKKLISKTNVSKPLLSNSSEETSHSFQSLQCLVCMEPINDSRTDLYHKNCLLKTFGISKTPMLNISTEDLDELALVQLNQRLTLTGVQKKISLSLSKDKKNERLTVVGVDGRFILKPSTQEFPEMAEVEHLSMKLAEKIGIKVAQCGLVFLESGEKAYITRRFDRVDSEKIQVEDFCQLSEKSTSKKYTGSCESLGKILDKFSNQPQDDKLTLFEILLFSFWIGNADMHLKNFSLWRDPQNQLIRMSPGYDFVNTRLLIPKNQDGEELALPLNGKKSKLRWSDFAALGGNLKIPTKVQENVREKILDHFFECEELIEKSFLSDKSKESYLDILIERSNRLSQNL